jgi:hypothetical protein
LLEFFFSTFIYEKVGRGYANQSKASRAEKLWAHARRVARNRKPYTHMRKLKPWSLATGVARNRTPVQPRTRATQSRGPLQQESHASPSRTRTNTYTRKSKPWAQTRVARFTKPHPYNHVHAQPKAVVPCNRSRTHHQAAPVQTRTRATQRPWSLQQESQASSSRRSTQSNRLQLS